MKKTIKRLGRKIKENAFFIVVLVGLMLLPYIFTPKTAVIYYANSASEVTFRLNVPERQTFDVRSNDAKSGYVLFEPVEGAGLSLENTLAEEDMYTYSGQTRVDSNGSYLHITFEKADRSAFSCKIEIEQDKEHDGEMNRIHVSDLPEDVEILFNNGNDTTFHVVENNGFNGEIPDGEYRVEGCRSVYLYMSKPEGGAARQDGTRLSPYAFDIEGGITEFYFLNISRTVLEATANGETDFHDIGHVRISGESAEGSEGDPLWIKIPDTGTWPIEFELSGTAEELKIGGSYYNLESLPQWIYENWNTVLLSVLGTLFAAIISHKFEKKEK